jgi:hypothetical protein
MKDRDSTIQLTSQTRTTAVTEQRLSNKHTNSYTKEWAKPKSIFKTRTKRWNANLLALTLFDQSPEISRPDKPDRNPSRHKIWSYDFGVGGSIWGRRKRDIRHSDYDFEA